MIPISSARMNGRIESPPKRSSAVSVKMTTRLVLIDRARVCRIEWFTIAENRSPA